MGGEVSITEGEEITGTEIKSEIEERERETMKGHRTNRIAFTPLEPYSSLSMDEDLGFHGMQRDLKFSVTSPFTWIHRVYEIYECSLFLFG